MVPRGGIVGVVVRDIKCPLVWYVLMDSLSISITGSEEERREEVKFLMPSTLLLSFVMRKRKKNAARIWAWLSQIPYHWATGHNTHVSDHWTLIGKPNLGHRRVTSVYAGMSVRMHFPCVKFCLPHSQANSVNEKFLHCMRQKAGWDLGTTQWVWYLLWWW